jgi:hypothetical protein
MPARFDIRPGVIHLDIFLSANTELERELPL